MRKLVRFNMIIMFLGIIFLIPILTKIQKNHDISLFENRKLAELSNPTVQSLYNGEYFKELEPYLSDHIFARNYWVKGYTYLNMHVVSKSKINNIVIGKDGFLLPFHSFRSILDRETYEANIKKMSKQIKELDNKVGVYSGRFYFVGIPEQSSYNRYKYPEHFENRNEYLTNLEEFMFSYLGQEDIEYINMNEVFKTSEQEGYYFNTDHHYNFNGAYKTYYEIIKMIKDRSGLDIRFPLEKDEMEIITLSQRLMGTRNRALYYLYPTKDQVQIAYPKEKIAYQKLTNGVSDPDLYYFSDNATEVSYGVYMGGDKAETVITTNRPDLPNLLIFGDSFTNAIEPLIYYHFNETRILDLRYYNEMSLFEYVEKYVPDVVIMVRDDLNYGNLQGNGRFDYDGTDK